MGADGDSVGAARGLWRLLETAETCEAAGQRPVEAFGGL